MSITASELDFSIKTEVFEGPLDLLLDLVERRKLLINDISLAKVTDEYMAHVGDMQAKSLPNTSRFVALAATLLLIKSKSLLPVLELTSEEEGTIDDLEARLRLYQIYRDAGRKLGNRFGRAVMYEPQVAPPKEAMFVPDDLCRPSALLLAMAEVLKNLPRTELKPQAKVKPTISLEDMIEKLRQRVEKQMRTSFFEMKKEATEHKDVIVSFLAILELVKQGEVMVRQVTIFDDIEVENGHAGVPSYY